MTDVLIALAAGYLASVLVLWALWVSDRRAERREQLLARVQPTEWLCPYCPDSVKAYDVLTLNDGALEHLRLCAFLRVSGSWEAVA